MKTLPFIIPLFLLVGCASAPSPQAEATSQTRPVIPIYVHFGIENSDSIERLLSARIYMGEPIFVGGEKYWELTGSIENMGTNFEADLNASIGSESQFYKGEMSLEKPVFGQGGGGSGGVAPLWFAISTNSNSQPILQSVKMMIRKQLEEER